MSGLLPIYESEGAMKKPPKNPEPVPPQTSDLRRQAEEKAARLPKPPAAMSPEETQRTLHELQVHQIELELQNEELRRAQVALDESCARYLDLYDFAPVGYVTVSEKGVLLEVNLTVATLLGVPRGALAGQMFSGFIHKEDQDTYYRHRKQLFETGAPQAFDLRMKKPDGAIFWAHLAAITAQNAKGEPACRMVLHDITARKQAEAALRGSEAEFRVMFEVASIGMGQADPRTGLLVRVNQKMCAITGYSADELLRMRIEELTHPDDRQQDSEAFQRVVRGEAPDYQIEKRYLRKDGTVAWVSVNMTVLREADGRPTRTMAAIEDITARRDAEAALRKGESLFRDMFERHAAVKLIIDPADGTILNANQAAADYYGWPQDRLRRMRIQDINTLSPDEVRREMEQASRHHRAYFEFRHRRADGSVRDVAVFSSNIAAAGAPVLHSIVHDITVQKDAERQRSMSLQVMGILNSLEGFQAACSQMLAVVQREFGIEAAAIRIARDGEFRYFVHAGFPPAFVESEDHLCSRNADGTVQNGPDCRPLLECTCGLVLEGRTDPASPLFSPGGSAWTNDAAFLAHIPAAQDPRFHPRNLCAAEGYKSIALIPVKSGALIVGLLQLNDRQPGRFSPEKIAFLEGIAGSVGIALARGQSEDALRESEMRYDQLAEQNRSITWEVDADGLYTYVSHVAEQVLGYRSVELVGRKHFYDLHPAEGREAFRAAVFAVFARREAFRELENQCRTCDGRIVWVVTSGFPILDAHGRLLGYRGSDTDITVHKQAEVHLRQAQKMESVGQLAGGVAHDFNNLLMGIMGYAELCRDQIGPAHPIREWLDEIMVDAQRSAAITRQLLAFARQQPIAPVVLDLNDTVSATLKLLRRLIGEDIELVWIPGAGPVTVKMDPSQVDQVLANLAVNARDAIGGVGQLTIETGLMVADEAFCVMHADAAPGEYVALAVGDSGCGMDEATIAHIFEPFFTTKETGKGTGLGLATIYGIVSQNNGFVTVDSEPGRGTTFTLYLPRWFDKVAAADAGAAGAADPRGTETVLLVEDEKSVRITAGAFLMALGYTVLFAETPETALRMAAGHAGHIHLLVTDVVMPGLSGRDLAVQLAVQRPAMRCLFISGYTADIIARRGILDQDMDFLSKPFTRAQFAAKVRAVLDRP
jgi:PAS domain S-box-containing protein